MVAFSLISLLLSEQSFAAQTVTVTGSGAGIQLGQDAIANDTNLGLNYWNNPYAFWKSGTLYGNGSTAIGYSANANDRSSIAIGANAQTVSGSIGYGGGIAIGPYSYSSNSGTAIGNRTTATGISSLAFGRESAAIGTVSVAIGTATAATSDGSVAVGASAQASGSRAIAIGSIGTLGWGSSRTIANGEDAIAIGSASLATSANSIALGAHTKANQINDIVIGTGAQGGQERTRMLLLLALEQRAMLMV